MVTMAHPATVLLLVTGILSTVITAQPECEQLGDVVMVLDSSRQVQQETWDAMIRLVQELSYRLAISYKLTRVAIVVYGDTASMVFPFNRYYSPEEVSMAVGKLSYQSDQLANLTAALSFVESSVFLPENGERPNAPDAAIFITASQPTVLREKVFLIASQLRRSGVRLFTVGIDGRVDRVELRAIATNPDDTHFFYVRQPSQLAGLTNKIANDVCRDLQLCTEAADLVFILDTSGSVKEEWTRSLRFARNLVELLPVGENNVRVAGVVYSNYAYRQFNFNTSYTKDGIKELIDEVVYHDKNTNTSGGLRLTRTEMFQEMYGNREGIRDVGVLITDGESTWETYNLPFEAWQMHQAGIQMYAIGLGALVNRDELRLIASNPDIAHMFMVDRAEDQINNAIILKWSDCEIDITYCTKKIDLVFVLDQSGSIGEPNFNRMLNFVRTLMGVLDISAGTARVGVVLFGDSAEILFTLNKYELAEDAARAILDIRYGRGSTDTAGALRLVREEMFTVDNGDRPGVPNFVIIVTDGDSNDFSDTIKEARALKEVGVTVLALGVGDPRWLRDTELRAMASAPRDRNALQVRDFEALDRVVQALQDATCNETNECLKVPCENGGTCRNGTNQYSCTCTEEYAGKDCQYRCPNYYDVVIAVDASGSVGETNFYKMLDFLSDFIGDLPARSRIGILTYSDGVEIKQHLDRYNSLKMTQDTIYYPYTRGATNTAAAIRTISESMFTPENGDRPLVPNIGIIITDGKSRDRAATWKEAVKARNKGIHLVVVAVTNSVSQLELEGIASGPDKMNIFRVQRFDQLPTIEEDLLRMMCNADNECDSNRCRNGATCLDGLSTYHCLCPRGFVGTYCQIQGRSQMDLALLIDGSGSVQRENFPRLVEFTQAVVNNLDVSPEATRVAAITFGSEAVLQFRLDEYPTKYDVMHALAMMPYRAGTTNMAAALRLMQENVFSGTSSDRAEVPNYAVILTDGDPDDLDAVVKESVTSRIDGTRILVVGIGVNGQRHLEYSAISSYPQDQTLLSVNRFSQLPSLVDNVTQVLTDDKDYCIGVDCGRGKCTPQYLQYRCTCPAPFTGTLCQRRCTRQMDLALVVDVSADATKDFPLMLSFLREIIGGLNFNFGATRVSFVCFDSYVKTQFLLQDYISRDEVLEAITLPKRGSGTDITSALYTIRDKVFKQEAGDRKGVPNYVILLSDGQDSYPPRVDIPDVVIYTVGIGNNVNRHILNEVNGHQSVTTPEFQRIQRKEDIPKVLDMVLENLCT